MRHAIHQNSGQRYFTIPELISFDIKIMGTFIPPQTASCFRDRAEP